MPMKSFVVLVVLLSVAAVLFVQLASMPGTEAERRGHPQAKAIKMLGWLGLPIGVVPWLIAMIWSQLDPFTFTRNIDAPEDNEGSTAGEQTASD